MGCESILGFFPALSLREPVHLGEEKHCESKVSCPITQHNVHGQGSNRTNYEATTTIKSFPSNEQLENEEYLASGGKLYVVLIYL